MIDRPRQHRRLPGHDGPAYRPRAFGAARVLIFLTATLAATAANNAVVTNGYELEAQAVGAGVGSLSGGNGLSLDGNVADAAGAVVSAANGLGLASGFRAVQNQLAGDLLFANGFENAAQQPTHPLH